MGGVFRLPIIRTDNIISAINDLHAAYDIKVYGAALGTDSVAVSEVCLKGQAVIIGNEGNGLADDVKSVCDGLVIIPISKESESLNAAVAASILAWEMVR